MKVTALIMMYFSLLKNCLQYSPLKVNTSLDDQRPLFFKPIANVTIPVGRDLQLACVIQYLGKYKVAWIRVEDKSILTIDKNIITRNYRFNLIMNDNGTFILSIKNIQESDRGGYMCQINTVPMRSQVGYVDVVVPPMIINDNISSIQTVREGGNVTLECKTRGHPIPVVKWRREDNKEIYLNAQSTNDEQLIMNRVTRNQSGVYLCIASNGVPPAVSRRIILQVNFAPVIYTSRHIVPVKIGQNVSLYCHVEAFPVPKRAWIKNYDQLIETSAKYKIEFKEESYKSQLRLMIRNLQKQDLGSYTCFASNRLGNQQALIIIKEFDTNEENLSTNDFNVKDSRENKSVNKNGDNLTRNTNQAMANKIKDADEIEYLKDIGNRWTSAFFISGFSFIFSSWLSWTLST